ncbi:hypothetical protein VB715_19570 [Crocosphaera sp. UHCC 0190]|uniref:hypothetical protein n=1 Tax=Crocosphaera sp. UHCC 0190 TaxID=3110246 RepID=UPI002B21B7A0|nr:hypothetical protein [Crocosphaera sp. UHCC 0190]MEA5511976.1 hypothetical protein [Crocosphaera sp. UHCC 0190]
MINRYKPTALENKLYTVSRAARILKLKSNQIEFVYPCEGGCLIGLWNDAVFIKKADFLGLLSGDRRQRSKALKVTQDLFRSEFYRVRNHDKNSLYMLECHDDNIECECQDYKNLVNDFGNSKVACKHVYAVLSKLGYGTLNDYIKGQEKRYVEPEYGTYCMAQGHY